jgi:micrococcal nuclease
MKKLGKKALFSSIMAMLVAGGYGGYTIVKKSRLADIYNRAELVSVIDGDTIKVKNEETGTKNVRLIGLDAPELEACFGQEAKQATEKMLKDKVIRLDKDISETDIYDRLLRYLIVEPKDEKEDNILFNEYLIRQGLAFYYPSSPNNRFRELLMGAEKEARDAKRGMWGACDYLAEREAENSKRRDKEATPPSPDCVIKGNISEKGFGKIYFIPGCDNYNNAVVDLSKGEKYFCTAKEAEKAGFQKAANCP